jgi:hypothetical protein
MARWQQSPRSFFSCRTWQSRGTEAVVITAGGAYAMKPEPGIGRTAALRGAERADRTRRALCASARAGCVECAAKALAL